MRTVVSLLVLLVAGIGAGEAWAGPMSDFAPMTETHAPAEVEAEVETEAEVMRLSAEVDRFVDPVDRLHAADAFSEARGVPPTPPPER